SAPLPPIQERLMMHRPTRLAAAALLATLPSLTLPSLATAQTVNPAPQGQPAERLEGTVGQSGSANNSGMHRPGGGGTAGGNPQAGNSATVPPSQREQPAGTGTSRTEGPSLEQRQVGPDARPDQTPRR
ncbi:hypothetical protein, partial [Teichococcus deserti]|uniref:hypothetical protein n=1 Tax=Teichococcus deserti TaxID=1817963 RepID=UPI001A963660